jgi:hypothetical protein
MKVKAFLVLLAAAVLVLAVGGWTVQGVKRVFGARRPKLAYASVTLVALAGTVLAA